MVDLNSEGLLVESGGREEDEQWYMLLKERLEMVKGGGGVWRGFHWRETH